MTNKAGLHIREARKAKGFTQDEVAAAIGVTPSAVSQWESGNGTFPSQKHMLALATLLGVTVDRLMHREWRDLPDGYKDPRVAEERAGYGLSVEEQALLQAFRLMNRPKQKAMIELFAAPKKLNRE